MDNKQLAAVIAVQAYLQSEQPVRVVINQAPTLATPWVLNGRQTQMQNRQLVQRRVVKR